MNLQEISDVIEDLPAPASSKAMFLQMAPYHKNFPFETNGIEDHDQLIEAFENFIYDPKEH